MWIRSQGRQRLKEIDEVFEFGGKIGFCDNAINGIATLGEYNSTERALEVLDEIQQNVVGKIFISQNPIPNEENFSYVYNGVVKTEDLSIIPVVYEMPKE